VVAWLKATPSLKGLFSAGFSLRNPYTIIVGVLVVVILGVTAFMRMPVDVFPNIKIPAVVVATFYQGMPPLDMEGNITAR